MASKSRKNPARREIIARTGRITNWTLDVHVHARARDGVQERESGTYLIVEGEFTEALNGVSRFMLQVWPETEPSIEKREIPSVGSLLSTKPRIEAAGPLTFDEFRSVLALATTGNLVSFRMAFQRPLYGKTMVASMSFGSDAPEDE